LNRDAVIGLALLGWFAVLAIAEVFCADTGESRTGTNDSRLVTNFGLTILVLLAGTVAPFANVGASTLGARLNIGFAQELLLPWAVLFALMLLAQTFVAYWLHRLMHRTPLLWRVHRVHHADSSVDVSTSLRSHPLELLLTLPASALVILLVGAPVSVVLGVQALLTGSAIWQHADIRLPARIERALSYAIFTPRLHRLHHNPQRPVHDSNYGELLILWDWLFGTLNRSEGRRPVGLERQAGRPDHLLDQIVSPLYAA
jgi:sterol desaturase/sphingolipid hydroxylase (fatty acid hydroxylase superfamily)